MLLKAGANPSLGTTSAPQKTGRALFAQKQIREANCVSASRIRIEMK
jgi:hypothetical protein